MGLPGIKEDAFGKSRFTSINMRDDTNIADIFQLDRTAHTSILTFGTRHIIAAPLIQLADKTLFI
jgi:hypothetical protein